MNILIDMNLSPLWATVFEQEGMEALHWSEVGKHNAPDQKIMAYAQENNFVVFTHDLDFGDILAATGADSPSVIQVRTEDPTPEVLGTSLFTAIRRFHSHLERGALITIDPARFRARILPLKDTNE